MKLKDQPDLNSPLPREVAERVLRAAEDLYGDPSIDAISWIMRRHGKTTVQITVHPLDNEPPA